MGPKRKVNEIIRKTSMNINKDLQLQIGSWTQFTYHEY